jgi:hypothetical protein
MDAFQLGTVRMGSLSSTPSNVNVSPLPRAGYMLSTLLLLACRQEKQTTLRIVKKELTSPACRGGRGSVPAWSRAAF